MDDTGSYRQQRLRNLRRQLATERAVGVALILVLVGIIFYMARASDRVCLIQVGSDHRIAVQNQEVADRIVQRLLADGRGPVPLKSVWMEPEPQVKVGRRGDATVLTEEAAMAQLRSLVEVQAHATILKVAGRPVLAMLSPDDIQAVLDGIQKKFIGNLSERELVDPPKPHFAEECTMARETRNPAAIVMSRETAEQRLLAPRKEDVYDFVSSGQDLPKILQKHQVTRERLEELNPTLDLDHLQPGDKLLIKPGSSVLNFEYVVQKTDLLDIPFKTTARVDASLGPGKKKVLVEGKKGKKKVVMNLTYQNDRVVTRRIIGEPEILIQPVDEVVAVGTGPPAGQ